MPSSTASCTPRTALPSMARPCVNHRKNPPSVASLTPTTPSEPLKPSIGAAVRDHRNAVRDRSESLSAINRNTCPQSPESAMEQQTQRIYQYMALLALDLFARIIAMRIDASPPFSALFTLWLSIMAAVGLASRSAFSRHAT